MTGQQRGGGLLPALARVDRTKAFLVALALAGAGLFIPGVLGALLLYAVVAALAALLRLTWSVTPVPMRVVRLGLLAALAALATAKLI